MSSIKLRLLLRSDTYRCGKTITAKRWISHRAVAVTRYSEICTPIDILPSVWNLLKLIQWEPSERFSHGQNYWEWILQRWCLKPLTSHRAANLHLEIYAMHTNPIASQNPALPTGNWLKLASSLNIRAWRNTARIPWSMERFLTARNFRQTEDQHRQAVNTLHMWIMWGCASKETCAHAFLRCVQTFANDNGLWWHSKELQQMTQVFLASVSSVRPWLELFNSCPISCISLLSNEVRIHSVVPLSLTAYIIIRRYVF